MAYQGGVASYGTYQVGSGATAAVVQTPVRLYTSSNILAILQAGAYQFDLAAVGLFIAEAPGTQSAIVTVYRAPRADSDLSTNIESLGTLTVPTTATVGDVYVRYSWSGTTTIQPGEIIFLKVTQTSTSTGTCLPYIHGTAGRFGGAAAGTFAKTSTNAVGSMKVVTS